MVAKSTSRRRHGGLLLVITGVLMTFAALSAPGALATPGHGKAKGHDAPAVSTGGGSADSGNGA